MEGKHKGSLGGSRNASVQKTYPIPPALIRWLLQKVGGLLDLNIQDGVSPTSIPRGGVGHDHWRHRDVAPEPLASAAGRVAHAHAVEGEDEPPESSIPPPVRFEFVADRLKRMAKEKERIDYPVGGVVEAKLSGAEGLQLSSRKEGEMEIPDLSGVASSSTSVPRFCLCTSRSWTEVSG